MDLNGDQKELVELFVRQEILIGTLYKHFAKRFPGYKDFWTEMVTEEYQHASLIQRLTECDPTDKFKFLQGELRSNNLAASIKSISDLITGFKKDKAFSIAQAAGLALHLEKTLWEKKVFQYFEGDSDDVRRIMDTLNLEQEIHIKKIGKFALQFQKKTLEDSRRARGDAPEVCEALKAVDVGEEREREEMGKIKVSDLHSKIICAGLTLLLYRCR